MGFIAKKILEMFPAIHLVFYP